MKVLITGIAGFTGSHLADFILENGEQVFGIERKDANLQNIEKIIKKIHVVACDILDESVLHSAITKIKPDKIFHLAARTTAVSGKDRELMFATNVYGTANLLEAVRAAKINPLIHIAGSSAQYGIVDNNDNPINEDCSFRPVNFYGVSKVAQEMISHQYWRNHRLRIVVTRAFNLIGPRGKDDFVCSAFAKQIVMIEKNKQEPIIYVGNLDSQRDFTDVRDVVKGYWLALEKGIPGEVYNICSGRTYSMKTVLNILLDMSKKSIEIKQDPKRMRPSDVPLQTGNYIKFRAQTGWEPQISFKTSLKDLLDYWREQV